MGGCHDLSFWYFHVSSDLDDFAKNDQLTWVGNDRLKIRVVGMKLDLTRVKTQPLDRRLIAHECDDDVTGVGGWLMSDDGDVSGHDTGAGHTLSADCQSEQLTGAPCLDGDIPFDIFNRRRQWTRLDPAQKRNGYGDGVVEDEIYVDCDWTTDRKKVV